MNGERYLEGFKKKFCFTTQQLNMVAYLAWLYGLVTAIEVVAEFSGNTSLRLLVKPLLMPVLVVWLVMAAPKPLSSIIRLLIAAFFFSWVGDVALMFVDRNPNFFLLGLVGFLITHLLYAVAFSRVAWPDKKALLPAKWWLLIPLLIYFAGLISVIFPPVPADMKIPVAVYATVIAVMVVFAMNRYGRVNDKSFALVFGGGLLFMFSDSLIALNKFVYNDHLFLSGVWIMVLYCAAQYLIGKGMLEQQGA
ncbi:MAG: lysoplasmalogenase [Chitinophagales bacterium]